MIERAYSIYVGISYMDGYVHCTHTSIFPKSIESADLVYTPQQLWSIVSTQVKRLFDECK